MNIKVKNAHKITIQEAEDIYLLMQQILKREHKVDRTREHFWTISLSPAQKILNIELISMGNSRFTIVEPVEVFTLQKKSASIILIHNHPSGNLLPSDLDKDITDRLIQVGFIMKTPVQDHVIITEHSYYSFAATGLMDQLKRSTKYALSFELEKRYREEMSQMLQESARAQKKIAKQSKQEGLKKGEEKGLKKGRQEGIELGKEAGRKEGEQKGIQQEKLEIAKEMLKKGYSSDAVKELTGLSRKELEKLQEEAIE